MKRIKLESLTLRNFKGIRDLTIDLSDKVQINGANGKGKTTIFDAYTWLLFGKNSLNQNDFAIKTLDSDNKVIEKLEHEVEGVFNIDNRIMSFKRLYLEKWVTKRGSEIEELTGHETKYFIDDVPKSKSEYEAQVKEIISENIAKILSNPDYFNNQIKWQDRRVILEDMAGAISDNDIIKDLSSDVDTSLIVEILGAGSNFDDEKKKATVKKKKLKDELKLIPSRIDEVDRMKPEAHDFEALEAQQQEKKEELEKVNLSIEDENKAFDSKRQEVLKVKEDKFKKETELSQLEREQSLNDKRGAVELEQLTAKRTQLNEIKNKAENLTFKITKNTNSINSLTDQNNLLREEWKMINANSAIDVKEEQTSCPTCKRELDNAQEIAENIKSNYNSERLLKLKTNEEKGKANAREIKTLQGLNEELSKEFLSFSTENLEKEIKELEIKIQAPKEKLEPTQEMIELKKEIDSIVIPEIVAVNSEELKNKKALIEIDIKELETLISNKTAIAKADERINELNEQKRKLSQEIADLERIEFQIEAFTKAKTSMIESRVNEKFSLVKFKMFEQQLNGGEQPVCVCMVDGVPFNDLNTAMKINAGLDVINSLQYHYGVFAPVFIDHRESVSTLIDMNCQVISLKVDPTANELQILNV